LRKAHFDKDGKSFRWHALKGELAGHLWATTPRAFSPCGTVVDHNSVHLFSYLERHYKYFADVKPTIVEALLVPFSFEGRPVGTIWVVTHDERRRFDAEDARLVGNLGRFAAAAFHLRRALADAEEANRHRDECLEVVSHELRNPLFPMQLILELLADEPVSFDDVKRASGVMQRQLKHLERLVGDLKDVASIGRGTLALRKERVSLTVLVEQAIEANRPIVEQAGHHLSVALSASPLLADVDPVRLQQVIANLLNNAVKFTARGGHLRVSAQARDADAVIRVQDDGIGVEADMLDGIFELYAQVRPSDAGARRVRESASRWRARWSSCTAARSARTARARGKAAYSRRPFPWPGPPARRRSRRRRTRTAGCACWSSTTTAIPRMRWRGC
jgi:hypothetical protein